MEDKERKILHIFLIGFHHKKGCQIEFSYPELETLPEEWKTLSSLAMPDGAHNYKEDSVYFHLPSLDDPLKTVFGVSCFQQIAIENVKKKTSDMTRGAVQKAVCVLGVVPFYGYIQVKMELVTAAFFEKGDFTEFSLLINAYHHLNDCMPEASSQHLYEGLSVRELLFRFRHKTLLLFKLLLLEKKVIFFHSPVKPLCCTILSLLSLHPGLIREGLFESCSSCRMNLGNAKIGDNANVDVTNIGKPCEDDETRNKADDKEKKSEESMDEVVDALLFEDSFRDLEKMESPPEISKSESTETERNEIFNVDCDVSFVADINLISWGLPLPIFTDGNFCMPYLCVTDLDFLNGGFCRGFHGGAANVLFKQKKQCADVLIEIENCKIEIRCPDLRRQLFLTTEDLRFVDQVIKTAFDTRDSVAKSVFEEGSEDWIRAQFTLYLLTLLRTSLLEAGSKEIEHFNVHFVNEWKNTNNYKSWLCRDSNAVWDLNPGHPCAGTLSVADMKLRFSQVISGSESGRKINQVVATTGRAVGGVITNAKGALSHWWSSFVATESKID